MAALAGDGKEDALYLRQSWVDLTADMLTAGHAVVTVERFVAFWRRSITQMFLAMPSTGQGWRCARDILAICKENKDSAERPFWLPSFFKVPPLSSSVSLTRTACMSGSIAAEGPSQVLARLRQ